MAQLACHHGIEFAGLLCRLIFLVMPAWRWNEGFV